jgi:hypothetical protein
MAPAGNTYLLTALPDVPATEILTFFYANDELTKIAWWFRSNNMINPGRAKFILFYTKGSKSG